MRPPALADEAACPALPRWARLHFDRVRDRWVLLAPERVLFLCPTSIAILERCDGRTPLGRIVDDLAAEHEAPRETIRLDVVAMLQDLRDQNFLTMNAPP
ncbi:MAG TPA: pyrroloquinoline quinone biosynthesis peptide chaperone PqqD [Geminicoccaceae bacterium]|nr:pyrroloquinoline quinone biosynthesis peptide chaperone PqqD [Geminicoccaceae bacterium]